MKTTKLYYQQSANKWLRIVNRTAGALERDRAAIAAAFGIAEDDVGVVDAGNQFDASKLPASVEWDGVPPAMPRPGLTITGNSLWPLVKPPSPLEVAKASLKEKLAGLGLTKEEIGLINLG